MLLTIAAFNMMNARSLSVVFPILDAPRFIISRRVALSGALGEDQVAPRAAIP
jgi:hypothetical protein